MLPTTFQGHWSIGSGDLVGCFGFNGPLRQYFSLYRAVSQREGEAEEKAGSGEADFLSFLPYMAAMLVM